MALSTFNCQRLSLLGKNLLRPSVVSQILPRHKSHESKKWPGYYVMYNLENVSTINSVNRLKYRTTIVSGVIIALSNALQPSLNMGVELMNTIFVTFGSITLFLHLIGYFCNNVVGIIYSKKDSDEVKIAYVNYWGKRVDINTTYDDIVCRESSSRFRDPLFSQLLVKSQNKKLRLFVKGRVIDAKNFDKLMGTEF